MEALVAVDAAHLLVGGGDEGRWYRDAERPGGLLDERSLGVAWLRCRDGEDVGRNDALGQIIDALEAAARKILESLASEPARALAVSVPFMRLAGHVVAGWQLVKAADVAARRLAAEEGIFGGISSGGALWAALQVSRTVQNAVITVTADPTRRLTYGQLIGGRRFNVTLTGANVDATTGVAKLKPVQALKIVGQSLPRYDIVATTGPEHERIYECVVRVDGGEVARGSGPSRRAAEAAAAEAAIDILGVTAGMRA